MFSAINVYTSASALSINMSPPSKKSLNDHGELKAVREFSIPMDVKRLHYLHPTIGGSYQFSQFPCHGLP